MDELQAFVSVVQAGSFTAAARRLDVPKSTVSRRVAALEQRLGVQLLHRTTRSVRPTDLGVAYFDRVEPLVAELDEADATIGELGDAPRGSLQVTAPASLGHVHLSLAIARYAVTYPDVRVRLHLTDRLVNLVEEGFDLALRAGSLAPSTLRARRLGTAGPMLCASPDYLRRRGTPGSLDELLEHDCLVNDGVPWGSRWPVAPGRTLRVRAQMTSNSWEVLREAALAGVGVGYLPDSHVARDIAAGRLVHLLPGEASNPGGLWLVYPPSRYLLPKVRTFVDFLSAAFAEGELAAKDSS